MKTLLLLLCCCGAAKLTSIWTETTFVHLPRRWGAAQDHCHRVEHGDLLIMETQEDYKSHVGWYHAWIGLNRLGYEPNNGTDQGWKWLNGTNTSLPAFHHNWDNHKKCAAVSNSDKAWIYNCHERHFSFCQDAEETVTFVNKSLTWLEAQDNCNALNQTLAMFNVSSPDSPGKTIYQDFNVWTGERHSGSGVDSCTAMSSVSKVLSQHSCHEFFPFFCKSEHLLLETEELSWDEAMEHCHNLSSSPFTVSLLSVDQNQMPDLLNYTNNATTTTAKVWLGLRFLAGIWFWSDGSDASLPSFPSFPSFPSYPLCPVGRCGALDTKSGSIEATNCNERLNLLCLKHII